MYYYVPLAYDRIQRGEGKGSLARCEALIKKARKIVFEHGLSRVFFCSLAGYTADSHTRPTAEAHTALCDQMKKFVLEELPGVHFYSEPQAWGTYEEVRYALQKIRNEQLYNQQQVNHVYFSTNFMHGIRVRICIWFLAKELYMDDERFNFHVISASHSFGPIEWFQEIAKTSVYLYKFIFTKM